MVFTNIFNICLINIKAILRENGLDDKTGIYIINNIIHKNNIHYITMNEDIVSLVNRLSSNNTQVISSEELNKYPKISCSKNGTGDRWANKKFNYTSIYGNKKANKTYSENELSFDIIYGGSVNIKLIELSAIVSRYVNPSIFCISILVLFKLGISIFVLVLFIVGISIFV